MAAAKAEASEGSLTVPLPSGRMYLSTPGVVRSITTVMNTSLAQRVTVALLILVAVGGALAVHLVSSRRSDSVRTDRQATAQHRIVDAVGRRAYYLEDVADMVGVHDDADVAEFTRYAHVRGRDEDADAHAVVAVQWVRRSPSGHLAAAGDVPPGTQIEQPILFSPVDSANDAAANAARSTVAAPALRRASVHKQVAVSGPVTLANGDAGVYIAVPVEAHRFSGEVSRLESRSAIVGLIDAQTLVTQGFEGHSALPLELKDGGALLASFGGHLGDPVSTSVSVPGQRWMVAVDGGSIPVFERALPWLILSMGLALAFAVARLLSNATRRRDAALRAEHEARKDLERAHADAERRSREDALTGIFNRRHFGETLDAELRDHGAKSGHAVILLDLDGFKQVNDEHGHLTGDAVLREVAERIASVLRESDTLARWGGEEFVILAAGLDRDGVRAIAERARRAVASRPIEVADLEISLTLSVGVALSADGHGTPDALLDGADVALYAAKHAGRNCVRVLGAPPVPEPS